MPSLRHHGCPEAGGDLRDQARNKDDEGVHDALNQGHGHHIAVGDVADFVRDDRFRFVAAHALQQAGADGDQRGVAACAGGEGVDVRRVVDSDLRHGDARLLRLTAHRFQQPVFGFVTRLFNHFPPTERSAIHLDISNDTKAPPKPNRPAMIIRP